MKKFICISLIIFITIGGVSFAQTNLVPNPGFEIYSSCPDNECQIHRAIGWQSFGYTPDYYNMCGTGIGHAPNNNASGYQYPASGNAFAGIGCYYSTSNTREYLGIELSSPLKIGKKYSIGFKAVSADRYIGCRINKIGLLFSTVSYALDTTCQAVSGITPQNFAHLYTDSILTDTLNWATIYSNEFIADSAYKYIIIGNFFDNANTDTTCNGNLAAYYYIDDIFVFQDTLTVSNEKFPFFEELIFPNPADDFIKFASTDINYVTLKNVYGRNVFVAIKPPKILFLPDISNGVYIAEICFNSKIIFQKLFINH